MMNKITSCWQKPIFIGKKQAKNRIVFPPMTSNWGINNSVSSKMINFYDNLTQEGPGLTVVEATAVNREGLGVRNGLLLNNTANLSGFKKLASIIKKNNSLSSIQIFHSGGQANPNFTGFDPVSPSGTKCTATGFRSKELSPKEILLIQAQFITTAGLAYKAGFDCVEIHLAHGYLLHQFLSKHTNFRNDEFGGNLSNRMRLIINIIQGIKKKFPKLILGLRVSGDDYLLDGINKSENGKILPFLERAGANYFSVSAGIYETSSQKHEKMNEGNFFNYSSYIKKIVTKPVIGVGKVLNIDDAEKKLVANLCDMVAIGRAQLADPFLIKKHVKMVSYNKCEECGQCQYLRFNRETLTCSVNNSINNTKLNILIMGGARFHGYKLIKYFSGLNYNVFVLNRGNFRNNYKKNITHIQIDRNNIKKLNSALKNLKFSFVIDNNAYNENQIKSLLTSLKGKCEHYIFTSSIAVYQMHSSERKIPENELISFNNIFDPEIRSYAKNKLLCEEMVKRELLKENNIPFTILRIGNIFGEGDFAGKLSYFYYRLKNNHFFLLEKEVRHFNLIYVDDVIKIFDAVYNNQNSFNKTLNIVDPVSYTYQTFFSQIFKKIYNKNLIKLMSSEKMWEKNYHIPFSWGPQIDTSLMEKLFDHIDFTPIEKWGDKSLEWELKHIDKTNICVNQRKEAKILKDLLND